MAPMSAAKWCIINTTMHYPQLLDLVPSRGRKQSTFEWVFWNNTQAVCMGKIWREKLKLVFHPTVSKLSFETDNREWRGPMSHHHGVGIRKEQSIWAFIWLGKRKQSLFWTGNKKKRERFDESQRNKLLKSFDKEETKGMDSWNNTQN